MHHRLLAAAIAVVAAALPTAAHASTVELRPDGTLVVRAAPHERNDLHVLQHGPDSVEVQEYDYRSRARAKGQGCVDIGSGIRCASGVARLDVALGDGDDSYQGRLSLPAAVDGGAGNDEYYQHLDSGLITTRTDFHGGAGEDTANYAEATPGVIVSKDGVANDGRSLDGVTAVDGDNLRDDVERLIGSLHNDTLSGGTTTSTAFKGGPGDDVLIGGGGENVFDMGTDRDGADVIRGGAGRDVVDFSGRKEAIVVTDGSGAADDGALGEGDDISGADVVYGGVGGDVIRRAPESSTPLEAFGGGGDDTLIGGAGADRLDGEIGADTVFGGEGADVIVAADGGRDTVDCGAASGGSVTVDTRERSVDGCEGARVSRLELHASRTAIRLRWTQPGGWRALRGLTVSVVQPGVVLGRFRIDPERKRVRVSGRGGLRLRGGARVSHAGDSVTARFRYRIVPELADTTVHFAVAAAE